MKLFFFIFALAFAPLCMATHLEAAKNFFSHLDKDHLDLIPQFYDANAVFQDPVNKLTGAAAIQNYYAALYKNAESIRFEYKNAAESGNLVTLEWTMFLRSASIESGKEITVDGVSLITFGGAEGKAIAHRDYFDMGEFIYERIPVLRSIISFIKDRMKGT
jgi:hypothetical protein